MKLYDSGKGGNMHKQTGFILIELLVVIAIIVLRPCSGCGNREGLLFAGRTLCNTGPVENGYELANPR